MLAATALLVLNVALLLGSAYGALAEQRLDRPGSPNTASAAAIAAALTPWSSRYAALQGWIAAGTGNARGAEEAYGRALRLAPSDPLLWTEYAQARVRLGFYDDELTHAIARARSLGPNSPAVQYPIAEMGLSSWAHGSPDLRREWLAAMHRELEQNRGSFLNFVLTRGQGLHFCRDMAPALGETGWCERVAAGQFEGCYQSTPQGPVPCKASR